MGWGEFYSLAAPMTWALAVILFRRSGETLPPFELNLVKNVMALVLMVPTLLLLGQFMPDFTAMDWTLMLVSGALGMALGDTFYLRAINMIGASRSGIVGSLLSPFVIVLSALFLAERLSGGQWLGFALVMAGILLVTWKPEKSDLLTTGLAVGVGFGALGVFLSAVGVVMVKELLETKAFLWVVSIRLLGGVAIMFLMATVRSQWGSIAANLRKPHPWKLTLTGCFLGGYGAMLLWLAGYKYISASEASIYNEAQGSFIVLFAWLMLGEAISVRKLAGLGLTLAGVITMLLV